MKTDAIFRIASMTKPLISVAAMTLAEEGSLDLDAPIAQYLRIPGLQVAVETTPPFISPGFSRRARQGRCRNAGHAGRRCHEQTGRALGRRRHALHSRVLSPKTVALMTRDALPPGTARAGRYCAYFCADPKEDMLAVFTV